MSHYTVLVIGSDPEAQLEPFYEQTEDTRYTSFFDASKEYFEDYSSGKKTSAEWYPSDNMWLTKEEHQHLLNFGELKLVKHAPDRYFCSGRLENNDSSKREDNSVVIQEWDDDLGASKTKTYAEVTHFKSEYTQDFKDKLWEDLKKTPPEGLEQAYEILAKRLSEDVEGFYVYEATLKLIDAPKDIPLKETYPNFSRYLEEYHGLEKNEDTGKYGYMENPNAKWDWYVLGGRWSGTFTLKDGTICDQAPKGEIDFDKMIKSQREEALENWKETEEMLSKPNDLLTLMAYGREDEDTQESYVERCSRFSSFAVLKDGEWFERGSMGWWGSVSDAKADGDWDEELKKLLLDIPDHTLLSSYDCHI